MIQKVSFGRIRKYEDDGDGGLILYGRITDETVDTDGDRVTFDAVRRALPAFEDTVREMHAMKAVGRILEIVAVPGEKAFDAKVRISKAASDTIQKIKDDVLRGFSIGFDIVGGLGKGYRYVMEKGRQIREILNLELVELSVVDVSANPSTRNFRIVKVKTKEEQTMQESQTVAEVVAGAVATTETETVTKATEPEVSKMADKMADEPEEDKADESELMAKIEELEAKLAAALEESEGEDKADEPDEDKADDEEAPEEQKIDGATAERMGAALDDMIGQMSAMREILSEAVATGEMPDEMEMEKAITVNAKAAKASETKAESTFKAVEKIAGLLEGFGTRLDRIERQPMSKASRHSGGLSREDETMTESEAGIIASVTKSIGADQKITGAELNAKLAHAMIAARHTGRI